MARYRERVTGRDADSSSASVGGVVRRPFDVSADLRRPAAAQCSAQTRRCHATSGCHPTSCRISGLQSICHANLCKCPSFNIGLRKCWKGHELFFPSKFIAKLEFPVKLRGTKVAWFLIPIWIFWQEISDKLTLCKECVESRQSSTGITVQQPMFDKLFVDCVNFLVR